MKLRKKQARIDRRLAAYTATIAKVGVERARGFHKPGSGKKPAAKGRGIR